MPHAKQFISFFFILISAFSVSAQNITEIHKNIGNSIEKRDYQTAINELQKLSKSDSKLFTLNNYDYLLARLCEKTDDLATAMANYQAVADRNSILKEYALWHLAEISRSTGNLMLERVFLRELSTIASDSLLNDATNARIARSYFESKDYETAISALRSNLSFSESDPSKEVSLPTTTPNDIFGTLTESDAKTRENLVLLGQAYLQKGNSEQARQVFTKLVEDLPNPDQPDDFALAAVRGLDEIEVGKENVGKTVSKLTEDEHLLRAEIYDFNRDFAAARLHYSALIERFPENNQVPMAMYQIGRGLVREKNFSKAADWFERVQAEFPESSFAKDALYQAASAYSRISKEKEAISRYQKYIEQNPNANNLERAYLNIVDIQRDQGSRTNALHWTAKTLERFKGKLPETITLFEQARIHLSQKDWKDALSDLNDLQEFSDLGGTSVPGGTNKEEVAFLRGYALEQLERFDEAIDVYLSIPEGRKEYYGWRATERLRTLANDKKTNRFINKKFENFWSKTKQKITKENADSIRQAAQSAKRLLNDSENKDESVSKNMTKTEILRGVFIETYKLLPDYKNIPNSKLLEFGRKEVLKTKRQISTNYHQTLADELLFLGLYDEGTPELDTAFSESQKPKTEDEKFTLAVYYKRGDIANRATAYIEPLWRKIPDDFQIELIPREQIELLYPAPYKDPLVKFATERDVDPRFMLSIMRQESRFRADVKSVAAARGLMQFISSTSNHIASEVGKDNFKQDELYNPPTAILFGSQYLSNLFKMFPAQHQAVAASYNGGEDNMERWLARASSNEPDRYVPEIIFSQTKDYVYKVMQNYRIYQMLYDENLKQKPAR
jgi:soluble lytic murein transglycosylase